MATTHTDTVRNSIANIVTFLLDIGSTNATAQIVIFTSGAAEVATLASSSATSFGGASSGTATAAPIDDDSSATGGTADNYEFQDRNENDIFAGSVSATGGGGDLELSTVTVPAAGTLQITAFTYTSPP